MSPPPGRLRVLVADDSEVDRLVLRSILGEDPGVEVVAEARDGGEAVDLARSLRPDVITMDANMPVLDGFQATERIMGEMPCPIVMVSGAVLPDVVNGFRAMEAGAVALLEKPGGPATAGFPARAAEVLRTVKLMAGVHLVRRTIRRPEALPAGPPSVSRSGRVELVAIAASTGGPPVLAEILAGLPTGFPAAVLCVQHIGVGFVPGLIGYLAGHSRLPVLLAVDGAEPRAGTVVVAPADAHLTVTRNRRIALFPPAADEAYLPSADRLFSSVASAYGPAGLGVVLTGMGRDGAAGLTELRQAGGGGLAQDEGTSAVFGMPRRAAEAGAVEEMLPAPQLAAAIVSRVRRG